MTNKNLTTIFSNNHNLSKMSNEKQPSNLHPMFESIADTINPNKKPFNRLLTQDLSEPVNLQKEHEESEYMKKIIWQYWEDVLNPNLPDITFTPLCESIYIRAALIGAGIGMDGAIGILRKNEAPTLTRQDEVGLNNPDHEGIIN